jgi:hypothetical protein
MSSAIMKPTTITAANPRFFKNILLKMKFLMLIAAVGT